MRRNFASAIDRQALPPIPPAALLGGAAVTVVAGGVLQQTGVIDAILDTINEIIGMFFIFVCYRMQNIL